MTLLAAAYTAALGTARAQVNVDIFSGHALTGSGTPYSGLVGTFNSPDIMFATDTGFNWHPFGLGTFGADLTGSLLVGVNGTYSFSLNSDDGSILFIDGGQVVDNGGPHGPNTVNGSTFLTAGVHPFEVQFFEDFGGQSGVDLPLPDGVTFAAPDVTSTFGLLAGMCGLMGAVRLRTQLRLT